MDTGSHIMKTIRIQKKHNLELRPFSLVHHQETTQTQEWLELNNSAKMYLAQQLQVLVQYLMEIVLH